MKNSKLISILNNLDESLDRILETRMTEAVIDQAVTWISKAVLAGKDIDTLLRNRSFLDFSKLMFSDGERPITTINDLKQALEDVAATDLVSEALISAFSDYREFGYDSDTKAAKIGRKFAGPSAADIMFAASRSSL